MRANGSVDSTLQAAGFMQRLNDIMTPLSRAERRQFLHRLEYNRPQATRELQDAADAIRKVIGDVRFAFKAESLGLLS